MTPTEEVTLAEVYGISRDVPLNYASRPNVDGALVDSLTRKKHLVIYGSSKQGKTCLRKWNLEEKDYIVITCSNKWDISQLHASILKNAGYTVEQSNTKTVGGNSKIAAKFSGKLNIKVAELGGELGGELGKTKQEQVSNFALELDPSDVNDVIGALNKINFDRFIVLEDFHYLPEETQKDFAVALKAFHEGSPYCFIVVGVWLDENRLIQYNGDLTGRVITINADAWSEGQLLEVINKGEQLLNIEFSEEFKRELIAKCFDSVSVVQESCHRACELAGVFRRQGVKTNVGENLSASDIVRDIVDSQSARYNAFITNFSSGFMETQLEMYKWLLLPVLTATPEQLEQGLHYSQIGKIITSHHPKRKGLNPGNLTQALLSTASLQVKLNIKPIILDYNQSSRRLNLVDRGFLIWLKHQRLEDLLEGAGLPPNLAQAQVAKPT